MIPRTTRWFLSGTLVVLLLGLDASAHAVSPACLESDEARQSRHQACLGKVISAVAITECPPSLCNVEGRRQSLLSLSGLSTGQTLTKELLDRAYKRLGETGYVQRVVPYCADAAAGVEVGLGLCSNTFVRKVVIEGNRSLHKREIKKRIFLRSGTILNLNPEDPLDHERVRNQARSIRDLYLKEGLRLAANNCGPKSNKKRCGIRFKVERVSATDLDITIVLSEMERRRIRRIEARHLPTEHPGDLQCPRVESGDIIDLMGISTGDVITKRRLRRVTQKLTQWFQSIGFVRPLVEIRPRGEPLVLEASVSTDKCWLVRVWKRPQAGRSEDLLEPSFRETDPVKGDGSVKGGRTYVRSLFQDWRIPLGFGNSGDFEIEEASRGVSAIHRVLESQGYLFADVVMEHRRLEEASGEQPVLGLIDYYITENRRRRIQGIQFSGLESFDSSVLKSVVSTKSDDVTETGFLSTGKVFADLARLMDFYKQRGFYNFRYRWQGEANDTSPTRRFHRDGEWLVWTYTYRDRGFQVRKRRGETVVYLAIHADEGPRSNVSLVQLQEEGQNQSLKPFNLVLKDGAPYGSFYLNRDLKQIEQHYQRLGHYAVKVVVMCDARRPEPLDLCDPKRVMSQEVDVFFRVTPGPKVEVGELFWRGNYRTDPSVLTRDFPKRGSPYIQAEIQDAARKLRNTGIFNSVRVTPIGLDEQPPRKQIALMVSVEESPSRFVDLAGGFRTIDRANLGKVPMLVGSGMGQSITATDRATSGQSKPYFLTIPDVLLVMELGYLDQNFLGRGQELKVPLEYGFSTTTPLRLFQTRPRWTIRRAFNTDLTLELNTRLIYADRVSEVKDFSEYSVGTTLTYPVLKEMAISAEVSGGLLRFEEPDTENIFDPTSGTYEPFLRTTLRWRWDNTDNPLHPTTGFALSTALSYIVDNELEGQRVISRNFLKWDVTAKVAQKIPPGFILALFARYGGSDADEDAPLPTQERYTLGNSNGMRGFADDAVGRYAKDGTLLATAPSSGFDYGGNILINGSLELRIPLIEQAGIWMVSFFDWGALAANHQEIYPKSFRFSAGLGLRYLLMNQIPVRLDWGAVIGDLRCQSYDEASIEAGSPLCERTEDRTAVHFGFLYPF